MLGFCSLIISTSTLRWAATSAAELTRTPTAYAAAISRPVPNARANAFSYATMRDSTRSRGARPPMKWEAVAIFGGYLAFFVALLLRVAWWK